MHCEAPLRRLQCRSETPTRHTAAASPAWPSNSRIASIQAPLFNRAVAKECRKTCGLRFFNEVTSPRYFTAKR